MATEPADTPLNVMQQGGLVFPWAARWVDNLILSGSAKTYNVAALRSAMGLSSTQALFMIFAADSGFWANFNGDNAAVPSGDVTTGGGSEYAPNQRYIDQTITSISFISASSANLSIQVFRP